MPPPQSAAAKETGPRMRLEDRIAGLKRQAAVLRAQNAAVTAAPTTEPRATRSRSTHGDDGATAPRSDAIPDSPNQSSDASQDGTTATTMVPGPVTDAVAHLCGNVTICGVWWPGALGDRIAYQSCMLHATAAGSADLDFGTSSAEYCASLYGGDCDDAASAPELQELCSLVPGVAAQWSPDYAFSRIVTAGDCAHYKTVALPEKNVLGLRLDAVGEGRNRPANGAAPQLTICTAKLYLRVTQ